MLNNETPIARTEDIVVQHLEGETLVYDLRQNKAFCLNETSSVVFGLCDGNRTTDEIGKELSRRLKTPTGSEIAWLALDNLRRCKLLDDKAAVPASFEGMSRRDVVKRIGFASAVVLPMIASIVAPSAVNAQSAGGSGSLLSACPTMGGPGCLPGLTCAECAEGQAGGSTPCASTNFCCSDVGFQGVAFTPGYLVACDVDPVICAGESIGLCCTSMGVVGPQLRCAAPGTSIPLPGCTCA